MKKFFSFFLSGMLLVTCTPQDAVTPSCESTAGLTLCESCQSSWASMNFPRPADSYNYSICPGTPEWGGLGTQRFNAVQIPPCVLEKMSTQAVIQALWEYPISSDKADAATGKYLYVFEGQESVGGIAVTNAWRELIKRKDAGISLCYRLLRAFPANATALELIMLELMLSQPVILTQLNDDLKRMVVAVCYANYYDPARLQVVGTSYKDARGILICRAMYAASYAPLIYAVYSNPEFKRYYDGKYPSGMPDPMPSFLPYTYTMNPSARNIEQQIINFAKQYLELEE